MYKKILVCGLPGSGKTTLAKQLSARLNGVHVNADFVRGHIAKSWDFSDKARLEQAERMKAICEMISDSNIIPVADFVCPTEQTRMAFGAYDKDCYSIFMNTIDQCRYENTQRLFCPPEKTNLMIVSFKYNIDRIIQYIKEST